MITTGSVLGCEKLCSPVAVGQGFPPDFSAQGSNVEHVSFQPAHDERTVLPHEGQNWSRAPRRECYSLSNGRISRGSRLGSGT